MHLDMYVLHVRVHAPVKHAGVHACIYVCLQGFGFRIWGVGTRDSASYHISCVCCLCVACECGCCCDVCWPEIFCTALRTERLPGTVYLTVAKRSVARQTSAHVKWRVHPIGILLPQRWAPCSAVIGRR